MAAVLYNAMEASVLYAVASSSHAPKFRCPSKRLPRHQTPDYAFGRHGQAGYVSAWATYFFPGSFVLAGNFVARIAAAGVARGATLAKQK